MNSMPKTPGLNVTKRMDPIESAESATVNNTRLQGRVVSWSNGWGFLRPNGWKRDLFVHYSQVQSDEHYKQLDVGDIVEFEIGEHNGRQQANNVVVVDSGR